MIGDIPVYRLWKSDGLIFPLDLDNAVSRLRTHGKTAYRFPAHEIERKLRMGIVLETPCAAFGTDRGFLVSGAWKQ